MIDRDVVIDSLPALLVVGAVTFFGALIVAALSAAGSSDSWRDVSVTNRCLSSDMPAEPTDGSPDPCFQIRQLKREVELGIDATSAAVSLTSAVDAAMRRSARLAEAVRTIAVSQELACERRCSQLADAAGGDPVSPAGNVDPLDQPDRKNSGAREPDRAREPAEHVENTNEKGVDPLL